LCAVLGGVGWGAFLPARGFQDLGGFVDVELPLRVLRPESRGGVDEVGGGDARAPVDLFLYGSTIEEQVQRPPHRLVAQDWMLGLGRRALAGDLGPRIGGVDLDVLDVATGGYLDAPV